MNQLRQSSAENAKAAVADAKILEASEDQNSPASPLAGASQSPAPQAPTPPASSARPNAFARPSLSTQAKPEAVAAPTQSQGRPSFTSAQSPQQPKDGARPSFGAPSSAAPAAPSRPSFSPSPQMPQVRGAFVKDPNKLGSNPASVSQSSSTSVVSQMNPQALFEIVCTHRKMSGQAIEAAKSQARDNPDAVMAKMRRIYEQEIAPNRINHTSDIPSAQSLHPGKVVFLLRKDDKERIRVMTKEEAMATGEIVLDGAAVENIHAAASPFSSPSQLFAAQGPANEQSVDGVVVQDQPDTQAQVQPEPVAHRSPKP